MRPAAVIIAIFLVLLALPFVYNTISRGAAPVLVPPPGGEKQCVEPVEYMRKHHVEILKDWRDERVRDGKVAYVSSTGKSYTISLTGTCLGCHSNKAEFCDRCHNYLRVEPNCFDCHVVPKAKGGRMNQKRLPPQPRNYGFCRRRSRRYTQGCAAGQAMGDDDRPVRVLRRVH